ncbi:MAG: 30S ribosomal protein S5 [Planctomycetes bacterium]|nr:30S ribosomal protein S5 [Planctomycetota bacterium]
MEVEDIQGLAEALVKVNRSAAVVKGGRRFSFSALSVSGNKSGVVGYGFGKARQVPNAIEKAARDGRKHLMRVPLTRHGTIPHEVEGFYCSAMVRILPASPGTGIIACPSVRAVCEMAGIKDILTKSYGSTNPINLIKATLHALSQLRTVEQVATLRGVELGMGGR